MKIAHFHDLAMQPRTSSKWSLHRVARPGTAAFRSAEEAGRAAKALTAHLQRRWRVTKPENRDVTKAVVRHLSTEGCEDVDFELGHFVLIACAVADDHAPADELLGPKAAQADVVLCMGRPLTQSSPNHLYAFALCRGIQKLVRSVLEWLHAACGLQTSPVRVSPHEMALLASEWTRGVGDLDPNERFGDARSKIRLRPVAQALHLTFAVPFANAQVDTVEIDVPRSSLVALHDVCGTNAFGAGLLPLSNLTSAQAATTSLLGSGSGSDSGAAVSSSASESRAKRRRGPTGEEEEERELDDGDGAAGRARDRGEPGAEHEEDEEKDEDDEEAHLGGRYPAMMRALVGHLSKHVGLDLNGASLVAIATPTADLDSEGRVRFFWPPLLKSAFHDLDRICKAVAPGV